MNRLTWPRILAWCLAAWLIATLAACAGTPPRAGGPAAPAATAPVAEAPAPAPYPLEVTDDLDRQVVIPAMPRRIVSISPTATEILFAIGAGDRVVAVDDASNFPAAVAGLPRVGSLDKPSLETIVELEPDLVVVSGLSRKMVPDLEAQGLTVVLLNPEDVDAVGRSIALAGRIAGRDAAALRVVADIAGRLDEVGRRVAPVPAANRVRVFHEVWHEPLMTAGPGSFIDDLIRRAGGVNILGDAGTAWPAVSLEVVVDRDPQVITTPFPEQFELMHTGARPGWENITAVREQRVYLVDTDLIARAGPRVAEAVELLAQAFYPALFTRQE